MVKIVLKKLKVIGVLPVLFLLGCNSAPTTADTVAAPAAEPRQGTYSSAQNVTLSSATEGAAIHYTIDGTTPTHSSPLYTATTPINIAQTTTLKAIAVKSGMNNSEVMTEVYTITPNQPDPDTVATPSAAPGQGTYNSAQTVALSSATEGAAIHYTIDGTTPTQSSPLYTATTPINIAQTTTLKAIAVKNDMNDSEVMTAVYTIKEVTPPPDLDALLYSHWPFMVGAAAPTSAFTTTNGQYALLKHFNVLVAENDMKPGSIMPYNKPATFPGAYNWTNADKLVNYAKANNTKVRGHVLVWHSQTPDYLFEVSGGAATVSKTELYARMEKHIEAVFKKYKGDVGWWDVCNEVVGDNGQIRAAGNPSSGGSWYTQVMEKSGLTGVNRYEFVLKAFQLARKYADANNGTNVKLYLTDYNIEYSGSKQAGFENLVDYLIANNAPIDGVGFQCHIKWDWPSVAEISSAIDKFSAKTRNNGTKLMTQVTELDMSLFSYNSEDTGKVTTLSDAVRNSRLTTQAAKYRQLFDMFKQKYDAGKLDMVLVWGLNDGNSWLNNHPVSGRTDYPLLFDRSFQPKEAYQKLVQ